MFTWSNYGTFLPDDRRGWRHRDKGEQSAQPLLEQWHRDRLKHNVVLLDLAMRQLSETALLEICQHRKWRHWASSARSNHVHAVVSFRAHSPKQVMEQLKAKATRELRQAFAIWRDRPVWSANGDIQFIDDEDELETCVQYVNEAQDRKGRDR
ncbi:MAG TPA: hypothetical protein DDW52_01170 [Planctomycetaceae bacterium]|nr:hypothetical protein [Planctomycetaceae bacterium]